MTHPDIDDRSRSDFIMHAAGNEVRARLAGKIPSGRKDFEVVFRSVEESLVGFIEITKAE